MISDLIFKDKIFKSDKYDYFLDEHILINQNIVWVYSSKYLLILLLIFYNMIKIPLTCLLLVLTLSVNVEFYRTHKSTTTFTPLVKTQIKLIPTAELPKSYWWGNVDGVNYLTIQRNQHIPVYCGSCWAFSATSALSDRIKIQRKAQWPDVIIAPQVLLSCNTNPEMEGCGGGDARDANAWIHKNNITDETCSPYQAFGHDNGVSCSAEIKCKNCLPNKGCWAQTKAKIYGIDEYGIVEGEQAMMN